MAMIPNNRNALIMVLTSTITRLEREIERLQRYKQEDAGGDAAVIAALQESLGVDYPTSGQLLQVLAEDVASLKTKLGDTTETGADNFAAQLTYLQTQLTSLATESGSSSTDVTSVISDLSTTLGTLKSDIGTTGDSHVLTTLVTDLEARAGVIKGLIGNNETQANIAALQAELTTQLTNLTDAIDTTITPDKTLVEAVALILTKASDIETKLGATDVNPDMATAITALDTKITALKNAMGSSAVDPTFAALITELEGYSSTMATQLGSSDATPTTSEMVIELTTKVAALATAVGGSSTNFSDLNGDLVSLNSSLKTKLGSTITENDLTNIVADIDVILAAIYAKIGISATGKDVTDIVTDVGTLITGINTLTGGTDTDATTAIATAGTGLSGLATKLEASDNHIPTLDTALTNEMTRLQQLIPTSTTTLPDQVDALESVLTNYEPQLGTKIGNLQEEINEIILNNCLNYKVEIGTVLDGSNTMATVDFTGDNVFDDKRHILAVAIEKPNSEGTVTETLSDNTEGNFFSGFWTAVNTIADTYYSGTGNAKVLVDASNLTLGADATGAFKNAASIKSIENLKITKNTWNISNIFNGCTNLESVDFSGSDMTGISNKTSEDEPPVTTYGSVDIFTGCTNLLEVKLPQNVNVAIEGTDCTFTFNTGVSYTYSSFATASQATADGVTTVTFTH